MGYFLLLSSCIKFFLPYGNFYFSENGNIVIVFDKYEVGAGSSGAPEFEINKEIYEKYMK